MSITTNITSIRQHIPESVSLVCVSKFNPAEAIQEAYNCGERIFGESKVQEMCSKQEILPKDISWHFIGHLQSNKIKYMIDFVDLIHGVDSFKLLQEINKQALRVNKTVNCLLQVHIATEENKFGFSDEELMEMFSTSDFKELRNISVCGLMGMATFTDDKTQIRSEFRHLKALFNKIRSSFFSEFDTFKEISMGMSDDFTIAIEEGSTMVRIGSSIFGARNYTL